MSKQACKLILALDLPDDKKALEALARLQGSLEWVKIGLQMYLKYGADFVRKVSDLGFKIFLDLKLYDIPNTVASAIKSVGELPIDMLTIHSLGGSEMMQRAVDSANEINEDLTIIAVTVLTSFNSEQLKQLGLDGDIEAQVALLAKLATDNKVKAIVCSPKEISLLRKILPEDVLLITPGIRPLGSDSNDQKRIMTPIEAKRAGASFIVVGRPILAACDPAQAAKDIIKELENE